MSFIDRCLSEQRRKVSQEGYSHSALQLAYAKHQRHRQPRTVYSLPAFLERSPFSFSVSASPLIYIRSICSSNQESMSSNGPQRKPAKPRRKGRKSIKWRNCSPLRLHFMFDHAETFLRTYRCAFYPAPVLKASCLSQGPSP